MNRKFDAEMVQVIDIARRRIRLSRGFNGSRAVAHPAGPWRIVMSPTQQNDDLGPDTGADLYDVLLELPEFSSRLRWLSVPREVSIWLAVGYVLVPMMRVGDPPP